MQTLIDAGSTDCRCPVVRVQVNGELDIAAVPRVKERLRDALTLRPHQLYVDMSGCTFMDAAGVRVLLEAHRCAWRQRTAFSLHGCTAHQLRLLALMGLREVFDVAPATPNGPAA